MNKKLLFSIIVALIALAAVFAYQKYGKPEEISLNIDTSDWLTEVKINVSFPSNYSLIKNNEINRRGSFMSYNFKKSENYQTPYLYELQFFSEKSIKNFTKNCEKENTLCFEGDYPSLARYFEQKKYFFQGENYQDFELKKFNTRYWFVSNHKCSGDDCLIREYTTFLNDTKLDVWILMSNLTEEKKSDDLFIKLKVDFN
ncbi:MAG: hypothetical protein PHZ25_03610 [Candidatus Pacebacteria bacterium]|nr:hypothetical protein [Candidatus Paceibacterota bacterium]